MDKLYGAFKLEHIGQSLGSNGIPIIKLHLGDYKTPEEVETAIKDSKQCIEGLEYLILPFYKYKK